MAEWYMEAYRGYQYGNFVGSKKYFVLKNADINKPLKTGLATAQDCKNFIDEVVNSDPVEKVLLDDKENDALNQVKIGIVGPSGAGKSSLSKLLAGVINQNAYITTQECKNFIDEVINRDTDGKSSVR